MNFELFRKLHVFNPFYDGFEVSARPSFFKSDLPCFYIGHSAFWLSPSCFFLSRAFHVSTQSFSGFFLSWTFCVSTNSFSFFWVIPSLFGINSSHLLSQSFPFLSWTFRVLTQSFSFFESNLLYLASVLPIYLVSPSLFWSFVPS